MKLKEFSDMYPSDIRREFHSIYDDFLKIVNDYYFMLPFDIIRESVSHNQPIPFETPHCEFFSFEPFPEYTGPLFTKDSEKWYANFLDTVFSDWFEAFCIRQCAFYHKRDGFFFDEGDRLEFLYVLQHALEFILKYPSLSIDVFERIAFCGFL